METEFIVAEWVKHFFENIEFWIYHHKAGHFKRNPENSP